MTGDHPTVSVLIPARNEGAVLARCLESLKKLDYPQERIEIIVADGMSSDDTKDIALRYGAKVTTNDKRTAVSGRNRAFEKAAGGIIACTDADCVVSADWIKNGLKYLGKDKIAGVGGVSLLPETSSSFEKAVNLFFRMAEAARSTCHIQNLPSIKEVDDIPTCNAFYRKEALDKVMPVDEDLLTAEDVWMNFCLKERGYTLVMAPDVVVWHHRRRSPALFFKQIYRFAIGRIQVSRKSRELIGAFHILAGLAVPIFLLLAACLFLLNAMPLFLALLSGILAITALSALISARSLPVAVNAPLVVIFFFTAWSAGFLKEYLAPSKNTGGRVLR